MASLFILDLLHCAPKSICQIQFVHKMEAGQKIVAITRHILTLEQVLYLDMCYIRTSLTFGQVLHLTSVTFGQVLHIWTSVTLGHVLMHCNGKVGFQHAQTHRDGGDSAIGLCKNPTCAFLLSARIEMCKDVAQSMESRRECNSKIALELISNSGLFYHVLQLYHAFNVLQLVNEGFFTAAGLLGLPLAPSPPSCHLMGSRLPKPNNSLSAFLDFNFPNVPQLSSGNCLNKSITRRGL